MTPSVEAAFAPARSSGFATNASFALRVLTISLALAGAMAAAGCGSSSSSTSTGPSPVKCQVSLEAPSSTIDATGGKGAITVSTQPECAWTASSGANWISGLSPATGQGSGQVEFQASANPAASMRQGDIVVNDRHIDVQQQPAPCRFEIAPVNQTMGAAGGTVSVAVTTLAGCTWQATSEVDWIAIGATDGNSVKLLVAANGQGARSASVLIAGQTFTLSQAASAPTCVFSLDRATQAAVAAGGSATVAVTASPGCSWTAVSDVPWITVVAAPSRTGSGVVSFDVMANPGAARAGTLTIAGQVFTVTQAGAAPGCSFSAGPASQSIGAAGGAGVAISVSTSAGCSWTAASHDAWITLTSPASDSGPGSATFTVAANAGAERSGTLTIAGQTITVNQAAAPVAPVCAFSIAPTSQSVGAAGGAGAAISITASAGCSWTAASNDVWITLTSAASGSGNGSATFTVAANTGAARNGRLTIAGQTFTVNQDAAAVAPACASFSIAPTNQSVGAAGGAGAAISITASAGCSWTAASNDAWITLTSAASGSGNGSATFSVAANTGAARSGTLTIAGQTFTVDQDAAAVAPACASFSIAPTNQSVGAAGGAGAAISITASAGCSWTAASNDAWITLTSAASGSGNGSATFSVAANTGAARSGTLTIAGKTFTVNQAAAPVAPVCDLSIAPTSQSVGAAGGAGAAISITTSAGCAWTAASNDAWITRTSAASGSGPGSAAFSVAVNTGAARSGTLTIAGRTFTVNQAAAPPTCTFSIAPTSQSVGAGAGAGGPISITTSAGCAWTAASNDAWITRTSAASGSGPGSAAFSVAVNTGAARSGTLTIAGRTFTVNQAAAPPTCTFSIAPTSQSVGAGAGAGGPISITTSAGCAWTAASNAAWITRTSAASGSGNGSATFNVVANTGAARNGTLTIAGHTFTVNQAAAPPSCTFSINPTSQSINDNGGNGPAVAVTTVAGCGWTANSNVSWITVTMGSTGTGNGTVRFTVAANAGPARSGTLTIGGQTFTVNQASGCTYSINPTSQSIGKNGGTGTAVAVTTVAGCGWTANSHDSWITVTAGSTGTGNGTVRFNVAANSDKKRTGTLTIAGHTFTVEQDKN